MRDVPGNRAVDWWGWDCLWRLLLALELDGARSVTRLGLVLDLQLGLIGPGELDVGDGDATGAQPQLAVLCGGAAVPCRRPGPSWRASAWRAGRANGGRCRGVDAVTAGVELVESCRERRGLGAPGALDLPPGRVAVAVRAACGLRQRRLRRASCRR